MSLLEARGIKKTYKTRFGGASVEAPEYHTANGRVVYGGGGITPDIFVPEDTLGVTSYYKEASMSGMILQFAFNYTDENRGKMKDFKSASGLEHYLKRQNMVEKFVTWADKNGLKRRNLMVQKSYKLLERYINSRIIYNMLDEEAWTEYLNQDDPAIQETLKLFRNNEAFPKAETKSQNRKVANAFDYRSIHVKATLIAHA